MDAKDLIKEYESLALLLGGVLMSAERDNQPEWMTYRDEVISKVKDKLEALREESGRILGCA